MPGGSGMPGMPGGSQMPGGSGMPGMPGGSQMPGWFTRAPGEVAHQCSLAIVQDIQKLCLNAIGEINKDNVDNAIAQVCQNTDCRKALNKLEIRQCARVQDVTIRAMAANIHLRTATMCVRGKTGAYCLSQVKKSENALTDATCGAKMTLASCNAIATCTWAGRCVRLPTPTDMESKCGDCAAKLARATATAGGIAASINRGPEPSQQGVEGQFGSGNVAVQGSAIEKTSGFSQVQGAAAQGQDKFNDNKGQGQGEEKKDAVDTSKLICQKDNAGEYCLSKKLTTLPSINASRPQELSSVTPAQLQAACDVQKLDECSRIMQPIFGGAAVGMSVPGELACARKADRSFCLPDISKAFAIPNFLTCITSLSWNCSAECATVIQQAVSTMGCCTGAADKLLAHFGKLNSNNMMAAVASPLQGAAKCTGLESVRVAIKQRCGGLSDTDNSGAIPEITFTVNAPCKLLDVGRNALTNAMTTDVASLGGAEPSAITGMRLSCSDRYSVAVTAATAAPVSASSRRHNFLPAQAATSATLYATQVYFRVTASDRTADVVKAIKSALDNTETLVLPETAQVVRGQCADCPALALMGAVREAANTAITTGTAAATCDAVKFMAVVSSCASAFDGFSALTDAQALSRASTTCASNGACFKAIKALGDDIVHCDASEIGGASMLVMLKTMCVNHAKTPCMYYLRQNDASKTCAALTTQSQCIASSGCTWNGASCEAALVASDLESFCGKCKREIVEANAAVSGIGGGVSAMNTASMELMCTKVGDTYCAPLATDRFNQIARSTTMWAMSEMCSTTVNARCFKMMMYNKAKVTKSAADAACQDSSCIQTTAAAAKELARANFLLTNGCKKASDGQYCIDKATALGSVNVSLCINAATYTNNCSAACRTLLTSQVGSMGCCTPVVQKWFEVTEATTGVIEATSAATASGLSTVGLLSARPCVGDIDTLVTSAGCAQAKKMVHRKQLGIKMRCSMLTDEVKKVLVEKVPEDLAALLAVAPESFTNVEALCDASVQAPTTDAPAATAAAARHAFRTLATADSGVAVRYDLQATDDFETERVSAELDTKIASGEATLTSTQVAVSEVCSTCGTLEVDAASSHTLSVSNAAAGARALLSTISVMCIIIFSFLL
eukprot:PhM_4_TR7620/c1_g1_i1/m.56221